LRHCGFNPQSSEKSALFAWDSYFRRNDGVDICVNSCKCSEPAELFVEKKNLENLENLMKILVQDKLFQKKMCTFAFFNKSYIKTQKQ